MKLLTFSTLFPNEVRPQHGIFVETSLRHLVATGHVNAKVIAPVPWFPFKHHKFGRYSTYARVPYVEDRSGIAVLHPRYPLPPKIGMSIAPLVLANAAKLTIGRLLDEGFDFDVIDAHYFYPDGAAAILLGRYFDKPVVITALGSDINILPRYRLPRRWIKWAAEKASGIIAVSDALKHELIKLSVNEDHIKMLRNGVDLELFHPCDRENYRAEYGLRQFTLLSVGNLIPLKGHDLVIKAMTGLPDARLLIAGEGPERRNLEKLTQQLGVQDRVTFLGSIPQAILRNYYVSADVLVLASSHEGWANVLLESMACGTPVIATSVG
ncbi:MAG: glycosyltransferase family 4 protein, partial [Burkholderiaceae bacterium]